jgi:hypothetical protein
MMDTIIKVLAVAALLSLARLGWVIYKTQREL